MIDDMITLLGKEQIDDDAKKKYCEAELDKAEDEEKELNKAVAEATDQRKEEHEDFTTN